MTQDRPAATRPGDSPRPAAPGGLLEAAIYAGDLDAEETFFSRALGLEVTAKERGRHVFFRCGGAMLLVFNPATTESGGTLPGSIQVPAHGARGPGHVALRIRDREIEAWRKRLQAAGVAIESEVRWPNGGYSIYFRDPAGNSVELATPRLWGLPEDGAQLA
ncbi:MAG TPA: VOC family protein [Planctomycetota bacterium]|jgi:catechol 2,3-dioxygenase-like lactoylglutathione lyase family enzyme|nr:VOC family protein [Planctomycetota bacterium]